MQECSQEFFLYERLCVCVYGSLLYLPSRFFIFFRGTYYILSCSEKSSLWPVNPRHQLTLSPLTIVVIFQFDSRALCIKPY